MHDSDYSLCLVFLKQKTAYDVRIGDWSSAVCTSDPFSDMAETGPKAVRTAFANQVAYCRHNDARVTARVVAALGALLDKPASDFARRIANWQGDRKSVV